MRLILEERFFFFFVLWTGFRLFMVSRWSVEGGDFDGSSSLSALVMRIKEFVKNQYRESIRIIVVSYGIKIDLGDISEYLDSDYSR